MDSKGPDDGSYAHMAPKLSLIVKLPVPPRDIQDANIP